MKELKKIWDVQKEFNRKVLGSRDMTLDEKQNLTKEYILHLISECDEVLREVNWKLHRKRDHVVDRNKLVEELIDVFKYWLCLAQLWDVKPEEFIEEFHRKSGVVDQKFKQEMQLSLIDEEKVVAIDIDGVLADYPNSFIKFIEDSEHIDLSTFKQKSYDLYGELSPLIPGGEPRMKELKHLYRSTGQKRTMGVIPGAAEALRCIRYHGYKVVLLTARPYKQYSRIFADTLEWLKKNNLEFDAILWDEKKEERVMKEFPQMEFMVEDHAGNANKVAEKGHKVFLINRPYNANLETHTGVVRNDGWQDIMTWFVEREGYQDD